jgi:hypothetical protein
MAGYIYAHYKGEKRQISDEMVKFIRLEQVERLLNFNRVPKTQTATAN